MLNEELMNIFHKIRILLLIIWNLKYDEKREIFQWIFLCNEELWLPRGDLQDICSCGICLIFFLSMSNS